MFGRPAPFCYPATHISRDPETGVLISTSKKREKAKDRHGTGSSDGDGASTPASRSRRVHCHLENVTHTVCGIAARRTLLGRIRVILLHSLHRFRAKFGTHFHCRCGPDVSSFTSIRAHLQNWCAEHLPASSQDGLNTIFSCLDDFAIATTPSRSRRSSTAASMSVSASTNPLATSRSAVFYHQAPMVPRMDRARVSRLLFWTRRNSTNQRVTGGGAPSPSAVPSPDTHFRHAGRLLPR